MPRVCAETGNNVQRVLAILELLAAHNGMTNSEVARLMRLPKSSTSYILQSLQKTGYVKRDLESGRYYVSLKLTNLGNCAAKISELKRLALPVLTRLVGRTKLIACLAVLEGSEVVYVQKVDTPLFRLEDYIGPRMDIHATAAGKALLAHLPTAEVDAAISHSGLRRWTSNTITAPTRFANELQQVRARGYAIDWEEYACGLRCIAAPLFGRLGTAEACVGLAGPRDAFPDETCASLGVLVRESAKLLSEQMGYHSFLR